MQTNYLLPNKLKPIGWVLFIIGLIAGILLFLNDYEYSGLKINVVSIHHEDVFDDSFSFFKIIENSIADELASIAIIIGGLIIALSKEKVEDEFILKLRTDSLVWALIFNYIILLIAIVFIYEVSFLNILVFNMFTPLLFFIIRFNFLKIKSRSHEE